jgi:pyruvate dehydrogenase E2 component (dihydrolipoamide acetyltransferase)
MQEEGYIAKLLYPEGTKDVALGQVVAIVVESKDDVAKFKDYKVESSDDSRSCPATLERPSSEAD